MGRVLGDLGTIEEYIAQDDCNDPKYTAHDDANEHQAGLLYREMICPLKDVWHCGKEGEKRRKHAGRVQANKGDNRFRQHHKHRSKKSYRQEELQSRQHGWFWFDRQSKLLFLPSLQNRVIRLVSKH